MFCSKPGVQISTWKIDLGFFFPFFFPFLNSPWQTKYCCLNNFFLIYHTPEIKYLCWKHLFLLISNLHLSYKFGFSSNIQFVIENLKMGRKRTKQNWGFNPAFWSKHVLTSSIQVNPRKISHIWGYLGLIDGIMRIQNKIPKN